MERISWEDKKKNKEVLDAIGEERSLVKTVVKRKKNWIGHCQIAVFQCIIELVSRMQLVSFLPVTYFILLTRAIKL